MLFRINYNLLHMRIIAVIIVVKSNSSKTTTKMIYRNEKPPKKWQTEVNWLIKLFTLIRFVVFLSIFFSCLHVLRSHSYGNINVLITTPGMSLSNRIFSFYSLLYARQSRLFKFVLSHSTLLFQLHFCFLFKPTKPNLLFKFYCIPNPIWKPSGLGTLYNGPDIEVKKASIEKNKRSVQSNTFISLFRHNVIRPQWRNKNVLI